MSGLGLLFCFVVLFILGWIASRTFCPTTNLFFGLGLPLPIGLVLALGLCKSLHNFVEFYQAWYLTLIVLTVGGVALGWRLLKRPDGFGTMERPKLSLSHYLGLAFGFFLAYFFLHSQQVVSPENDYLTHFPLVGLLSQGVFPPPNPYYPEVILHGHFGRDYLIALLSRATSGDHILTIWLFNHLLHLSAYLLAAGLGLESGKKAAVVTVPLLLFFGVSVGSRVGLVDTFDNNNLLVYTLLLAFLSILVTPVEKGLSRGSKLCFLAFLLGVYAIVYETHMILMLGAIVAWPFLVAFGEGETPARERLRWTLFACGLALLIGALMGGVLQDLACRSLGWTKEAEIDRFASYESQRVQIDFPKSRFLQVYLGSEEYNRVSYVYQTRLLRHIPPALDEGGYTFVFSPRFLVLHWLALYLGFPAVLFLLRQRNKVGLLMWTFGFFAFLTPAVVDFGPVHELEYFRWEFAAGFGFAGALGVALAELWEQSRGKVWIKAIVVLLTFGTCYGGVRRVNRSVITLQKAGGELRAELLSPFYGSGFSWLVRRPELELGEADIEATAWLRDNAQGRDRLLLSAMPRSNPELAPEATLLGLAGMRAVGHQSPPPWLPVGTYPYFHNPNWTVFWQELDPRALWALKADWIYLKDKERYQGLEELSELEKVFERGGRLVYRVQPSENSEVLPVGLEIVGVELPQENRLQSEVAYPLNLTIRNTGDQPIAWTGPLRLELRHKGEQVERPTSLVLQVSIDLDPGEESELPFWLVPALVEGEYELKFYAQTPSQEMEIASPPRTLAHSFSKQANLLSLHGLRIISREADMVDLELAVGVEPPGFAIEGPVFLGWRVWDDREKRYGTPFGFDGLEALEIRLSEPGERSLKIRARLPDEGDRYQLHFYLVSLSRQESQLRQVE